MFGKSRYKIHGVFITNSEDSIENRAVQDHLSTIFSHSRWDTYSLS